MERDEITQTWTRLEFNDIVSKANSYMAVANRHMAKMLLMLNTVKRGTWFIKNKDNAYYQFISFTPTEITLLRGGKETKVSTMTFVSEFIMATQSQAEQHETFLFSRLKPVAIISQYANKMAIVRVIGSSPTSLFLDSDEYRKLCIHDTAHLYNITVEKPNFIPMYVKSKPVIDKTPANSRTKVFDPKGFDPTNCEFYMVTCRGNYGAKKRHEDYQDAVDEAQRIATHQNHPCWVVGVVTKVNP